MTEAGAFAALLHCRIASREEAPQEIDMPKARWNGVVVAESDDTVVVEGNHYFPPEALNAALFEDSEQHSFCPWKGTAHYKTLVVGGARNPNAAWYYPEPKPAAAEIAGRFAFWKGVVVE